MAPMTTLVTGATGLVGSHVTRLLSKLGVRSRVGAVVLAYESGLIRPGGPREG